MTRTIMTMVWRIEVAFKTFFAGLLLVWMTTPVCAEVGKVTQTEYSAAEDRLFDGFMPKVAESSRKTPEFQDLLSKSDVTATVAELRLQIDYFDSEMRSTNKANKDQRQVLDEYVVSMRSVINDFERRPYQLTTALKLANALSIQSNSGEKLQALALRLVKHAISLGHLYEITLVGMSAQSAEKKAGQ